MLERIQVKREDDKMGEGMMLGTMGSPAAVTGELSQWERSGSIPEHTTVQQQSTPIPPLWSHNAPLAGFAPTILGLGWLAAIAGFQGCCQSKTLRAQLQTGRDFLGIIQLDLPRIIFCDSGVIQPVSSHPPLLWLGLLQAGKSQWLLRWISLNIIRTCVEGKKTVLGSLNWRTRGSKLVSSWAPCFPFGANQPFARTVYSIHSRSAVLYCRNLYIVL